MYWPVVYFFPLFLQCRWQKFLVGMGQFVTCGAHTLTFKEYWPWGQAYWAVAEEASAVARRVSLKYCIVEIRDRRKFGGNMEKGKVLVGAIWTWRCWVYVSVNVSCSDCGLERVRICTDVLQGCDALAWLFKEKLFSWHLVRYKGACSLAGTRISENGWKAGEIIWGEERTPRCSLGLRMNPLLASTTRFPQVWWIRTSSLLITNRLRGQ